MLTYIDNYHAVGSTRPAVSLNDDPISGKIQLENQVELRAPTSRHAAFYLDSAIAARTVPTGGLCIHSVACLDYLWFCWSVH